MAFNETPSLEECIVYMWLPGAAGPAWTALRQAPLHKGSPREPSLKSKEAPGSPL